MCCSNMYICITHQYDHVSHLSNQYIYRLSDALLTRGPKRTYLCTISLFSLRFECIGVDETPYDSLHFRDASASTIGFFYGYEYNSTMHLSVCMCIRVYGQEYNYCTMSQCRLLYMIPSNSPFLSKEYTMHYCLTTVLTQLYVLPCHVAALLQACIILIAFSIVFVFKFGGRVTQWPIFVQSQLFVYCITASMIVIVTVGAFANESFDQHRQAYSIVQSCV